MSSSSSLLSVRDVTAAVGDFRLGPVDLELEPGRVLAFVGANGAGKTTTIRTIAGLLRPTAGEIEVCGRSASPDRADWKHDIGLVSEDYGFIESADVFQHLRLIAKFYPSWDESYADDLLARLDLRIVRKVRNLSRGDRMKLSIISALARRPKVLLLDEPTNGLDPVARQTVRDALWEFLDDGERSILFSTHVLSDVSRLADEIAVIRDGRLILRETRDELTDRWRRFSFELDIEATELESTAGVWTLTSRGRDHQLTTQDPDAVRGELERRGARSISEGWMSIEEIAVAVLSGEAHATAA